MSPRVFATASRGSSDSVDATNGICVRATARLPWPYRVHNPVTPSGTVINGLGERMPNNAVDISPLK